MKTKITAYKLAKNAYDENSPIDWGWVRVVTKGETRKFKHDWAKNIVKCCSYWDATEQMYGRAANILLNMLGV